MLRINQRGVAKAADAGKSRTVPRTRECSGVLRINQRGVSKAAYAGNSCESPVPYPLRCRRNRSFEESSALLPSGCGDRYRTPSTSSEAEYVPYADSPVDPRISLCTALLAGSVVRGLISPY